MKVVIVNINFGATIDIILILFILFILMLKLKPLFLFHLDFSRCDLFLKFEFLKI
jgi:hypothetical protein